MTSKTRTKSTRREAKLDQTEPAERQKRYSAAKAVSPGCSTLPNDTLPAVTESPASRRPTKALQLREMLAREDGVSLVQMMEATGWQAHTMRAALSGLRKSGLTLERTRRDKDTIYRIVESGAGKAAPAIEDVLSQKARNPTSAVASSGHPDAASLDEANTARESVEVTQ